MDLEFNSAMTVQAWKSVNDGVMGGLSSGGPRYENESLVFEGVINTNGGGFSSIRLPLAQGSLAGYSGLKFRVKSDGRVYKLTLRGATRFRGRSVSFQAPLPASPQGAWADVMVDFASLEPTIFGQALSGVEFDITQVQEMGLIIADGKDGPFRLKVKSLGACTSS